MSKTLKALLAGMNASVLVAEEFEAAGVNLGKFSKVLSSKSKSGAILRLAIAFLAAESAEADPSEFGWEGPDGKPLRGARDLSLQNASIKDQKHILDVHVLLLEDKIAKKRKTEVQKLTKRIRKSRVRKDS